MDADKILFDLRQRLERQRGRLSEIGREPGLSASWISKFLSGVRDNPTIRTLEALDRALIKFEAANDRRAA